MASSAISRLTFARTITVGGLSPIVISRPLLRFAVIRLTTEPPRGPVDQSHIGCGHTSEACRLDTFIAVLKDRALARRHAQTPSRLQEHIRGGFSPTLHIL